MIKLHYYDKYTNLGDILNPIIFKEIFGIHTIKATALDSDVVALGSILDMYTTHKNPDMHINDPIHIWGTGFIRENTVNFIRPLIIHALRGIHTKAIIEKSMGQQINCVLADPGLLASKLVPKLVYTGEKKYQLGIIPHYIEQNEIIFKQIQDMHPNSIIIDVLADPMENIKLISQCELIISSSLHGLVIADSFNIPNLWVKYSDKVIGDGFKFRDYYSSFGLEIATHNLNPHNLKYHLLRLDKIESNYKITNQMVAQKQQDLINCFPVQKGR